jgi:stage III sporulation protein AG
MLNNFREWWKKFAQHDRPQLYRLIGVGILGLLLLGFGSFGPSVPSPPEKSSAVISRTGPLSVQEQELSAQLSAILQDIPGVRHVAVSVTLNKSMATQYVKGTQSGQGSSPVILTTNSGQAVVPLDELGPQVAGIVVVAQSARNPLIRSELAQAVETLLQVQAYQVLILPTT